MDKRILTIQDISCVGQCSLTVALPILSACGIETAILPGAVLSTHTAAGFEGFYFHDLTDDFPHILAHWKDREIQFDAFYTGYITAAQIPLILEIIKETARNGALRIVDPAMADNGRLYSGFSDDFPQKMAALCKEADFILPNLTEAAFLLGIPYPGETYTRADIEKICAGLHKLGAKNVVLTGISFEEGKTGCVCYDGASLDWRSTRRLPAEMHGTGDVFASAFTGALCRGKNLLEAASVAVDFTAEAIRLTLDDKAHWYGAKFEKAIPFLLRRLQDE
ncbi:MAG: pyridoxamine kinase [Treponemataceae bacterium]|nr:pyridoxamine kinase [Treponemataceae bacterium]